MGLLVVGFLWKAARHATSGVPGRFQAGVEMIVDMVNDQAKALFIILNHASMLRHWR